MKVLVLGATGYVGSNLVPRLIEKGFQVRCLVRDPTKVQLSKVEIIEGDASDQATIESAVTGCDRVIYLIHSMGSHSTRFEELDKRIATNVAVAAEGSGVKQIIYLGGLGNRRQAQTPHLRSRHEVAQILRSSNVPVTELRAAVIIGAGSASFEMIKTLVRRLPIMICPKWVNVRTQPIGIDDVVEYIAQSLDKGFADHKTIDIGGPTVLSYRDMMLLVARQMHYRRLIIPVPVLTPWLSSHWVNLVTAVAAPLARALIESVRSETICESNAALSLFDLRPLDFEAAVGRALSKK